MGGLTYDLTTICCGNISIGDIMSTILERLRLRQHTARDGLAELLEEAAREIERLRIENSDLQQRLNVERAYSSSDWPNDA